MNRLKLCQSSDSTISYIQGIDRWLGGHSVSSESDLQFRKQSAAKRRRYTSGVLEI
ncbi:hypothetical protein BJX63DRAFT_248018 [Aspergillus granulosus]|uniref:Uncharacterized protein n=1 Tax=Aspergillus granulosus TaxID=176169 RepID=A0ABR4HAF4_9EURO